MHLLRFAFVLVSYLGAIVSQLHTALYLFQAEQASIRYATFGCAPVCLRRNLTPQYWTCLASAGAWSCRSVGCCDVRWWLATALWELLCSWRQVRAM